MQAGIHPKYRPVIFRDASNNASFLIGSTVETREKGTWEDGKEYDLISVEVSSASHPYYTGQQRIMDSQGRVEKFKKRFGSETRGSTVRKSRSKPPAGPDAGPKPE